MRPERIRVLKEGSIKKGNILYWMSRDQRINDNWALHFANNLAKENSSGLIIAFCLAPAFLEATERQFGFMLKGLRQVERKSIELNIPFHLLVGAADNTLPQFILENHITALVCDFDPLKIKRIWKKNLIPLLKIPVFEVDAHNIVPALCVSNKEEFAAFTFRPKHNRLLEGFLDEIPPFAPMSENNISGHHFVQWDELNDSLQINRDVKEVTWCKPGEDIAFESLMKFAESGIYRYNSERNLPPKKGQSNLSPYLHFGQLSAQKIVLTLNKIIPDSNPNKIAFIEELVVRRELADNFCYFNKNYDNYNGFQNWAKISLENHLKDKREYLYSLMEFENAGTHDDIWNAAQNEMRFTGKMHGYMRMYWAKKILEWSISAEEAMKTATYLNDKYSIDGRDPNGYTGCAWSIGGIHDRAWFDRPVYGKIRYMNYNGCKSKFDVNGYISGINEMIKQTVL